MHDDAAGSENTCVLFCGAGRGPRSEAVEVALELGRCRLRLRWRSLSCPRRLFEMCCCQYMSASLYFSVMLQNYVLA